MKAHLTFILTLFSTICVLAQDPEFSMPNSAPLYLNPALAGLEICPNVSSNFRVQWPKLEGGFNTASISYDQYFHAVRGGVGLIYMYDWAGDPALQTQSINLVYAGHINIKESIYLRPAVSLGYRHRYLDGSQLNFGNLIDERYDFVYPDSSNSQDALGDLTSNSLDLGAGLLVRINYLMASISASHINQPDEGLLGASTLPMKLKAYLVYNWDISQSYTLAPQVTYYQQQDFTAISPLLALTFRQKFQLGAGTRFNTSNVDAIIFALGAQHEGFLFRYAYDYIVSKLGNENTGGSHEIGLTYTFGCKKENEFFKKPNFMRF